MSSGDDVAPSRKPVPTEKPSPETSALDKQLTPTAEQLARAFIDKYAVSLIAQGKLIAFNQGADEVINLHIEEAREIIIKEQKRGWSREILIVLGSALVGAFIQGFITELSAGHKLTTAFYTAMGFTGMILVFWALRR